MLMDKQQLLLHLFQKSLNAFQFKALNTHLIILLLVVWRGFSISHHHYIQSELFKDRIGT